MTNTVADIVRSILLDAQQWRDTYGNTYSSGRVKINGLMIGYLGAQYGDADTLEDYALTPYLESVGLLPVEEPPASHLSHRLRRLGIDYYQTRANGPKRSLVKHTELEPPETLRDTLERRAAWEKTL